MVNDDQVILIDFERFAWGQPEWDLSVTATEYLSAGWWTSSQYDRFTASYGYDVTEWESFPLLRSVQEIKMTTWIMQNIEQSDQVADEYARRIHDIRAERAGHWQPF